MKLQITALCKSLKSSLAPRSINLHFFINFFAIFLKLIMQQFEYFNLNICILKILVLLEEKSKNSKKKKSIAFKLI